MCSHVYFYCGQPGAQPVGPLDINIFKNVNLNVASTLVNVTLATPTQYIYRPSSFSIQIPVFSVCTVSVSEYVEFSHFVLIQ